MGRVPRRMRNGNMSQQHERFRVRAIFVVPLLCCFALLAGCSITHRYQPSAGGGGTAVEEVSYVRRLLRAACGKLREVSAGGDSAVLLAEAEQLTSKAAEEWARFLQSHSDAPPYGYSAHPDWHVATRDLSDAIHGMLERVKMRDAPEAFRACTVACGKFVSLNESAGVRRTSDVLFRFRKAAKPLSGSVTSGSLETVAMAITRLEEIRDEALREPVGGVGTPMEKRAALQAFSDAVDDFAGAVKAREADSLRPLFDRMMSSLERAYDLYL